MVRVDTSKGLLMKKIKISIDDLLVVLEAMKETNNTTEVIIFEYEGYPAITDANDTENVITFRSVNEKGEVDTDEETIH